MKRVQIRVKAVCFRPLPIPALAGSRAPGASVRGRAWVGAETGRSGRVACGAQPRLALHSSGSYSYHFRSSAASRHTSPAPATARVYRNFRFRRSCWRCRWGTRGIIASAKSSSGIFYQIGQKAGLHEQDMGVSFRTCQRGSRMRSPRRPLWLLMLACRNQRPARYWLA
jgi:hypothetical protein